MDSIQETTRTALELYEQGRRGDAARVCQQILLRDPADTNALHLLGVLCLDVGQYPEALDLFRQVERAAPDNAICQVNLGCALQMLKRPEEARYVLERVIELKPDFADAYYNLALVLDDLGRLDEAESRYQQTIRLKPHDPRAMLNLGCLSLELGKVEDALNFLDRVLAIDPEHLGARFNRALALLKLGRLAPGWEEYEARFDAPEFRERPLSQPRWDGKPTDLGRLLVVAEQGLGDTIQFLRYLPLVRTRCPRTIVEVKQALVPLVAQSGIAEVCERGAPLPPFDFQVAMNSLPMIFGTTSETIPSGVPYIHAKSDLVAHWRNELSRFTDLKVGIAWQGSESNRADRFRSIPLVYFAPLARVPGVQLISLQKGPGIEQVAALQHRFDVVDLGRNVDERSGPFMDTAAIMHNLDLVITCDTAIAHLAGALGINVWVALSVGSDWRWLTERSDSPWYPTMRLFRQPSFGDWPAVFDEMAGALRQLADR